MKTLPLLILALSAISLFGQTCLDFEDFALGTTFSGSQENISFQTTFLAQPVELPDGGTVAGGSVSVGTAITALGSGRALNVNNAAIEICLPGLKEVSFRFSNQGGYFNFSIDGSPVAIPDNDVGSLSVNGVDIVITGSKPNNRLTGEVTLTAQDGTFGCFSVGGQELQIDDICFLTCENPRSPDSALPEIVCVEFEDLVKQGPYPAESTYLEQEILFKIIGHNNEFGSATPSTKRNAGHLGLEYYFEQAGFAVTSDCWSSLKFNYSTKKPVTMTVNGISHTESNLTALNGIAFNDVYLSITVDPNDPSTGVACLTGANIENFSLTGEDLYIDHFCAFDCLRDCIDFEGEASDAKYQAGDTISEDGYTLAIQEAQQSSQPAFIGHQNFARGGGQELLLDSATINFGKYCFHGLAFQYAQLSAGVILTIEDQSVQVDTLSQLDGQTIAGMEIDVFVTQATGSFERGVVRLNGTATTITLFGNEMAIDRVCIDECPDPQVVGFEEEFLGETYSDEDTFEEDGVEFTVCDLRINDSGSATIIADNQTGGSGQAIELSFASLKFDLLCDSKLTFQFANFGANGGPQGFGLDVRLVVNGDSSGLVQNFSELHGDTLGGATISVTTSGNSGTVTITGEIGSIIVGGFNIQLDNLMRTPFVGGPQRHTFNAWDSSLTYGVFDEFSAPLADGTSAYFDSFIDSNNNFADGTATIGSTQSAGGGGQELTLNQATILFYPLLGDWSDVSFRFAEASSSPTAQEVSLVVNGDTQTYARISDLDGQVFQAGTAREVTAQIVSLESGGRLTGIVKLTGIVESLSIGGEALTIDDLSGTQQPAPVFIDSWVVSVEQTGPSEITYVWVVEALNVQESDFSIARSSNLSSFIGYSGSQIGITSYGTDPDLYQVTEVQPIDAEERFYRVRLKAF